MLGSLLTSERNSETGDKPESLRRGHRFPVQQARPRAPAARARRVERVRPTTWPSLWANQSTNPDTDRRSGERADGDGLSAPAPSMTPSDPRSRPRRQRARGQSVSFGVTDVASETMTAPTPRPSIGAVPVATRATGDKRASNATCTEATVERAPCRRCTHRTGCRSAEDHRAAAAMKPALASAVPVMTVPAGWESDLNPPVCSIM